MATKTLKWYGALPQSEIHVGKRVVDFSGEAFNEVAKYLTEQVSRHAPVMVEEHQDVDKATAIGLVEAVRVVSLEEARERGIHRQTSPKMIYFGVSPAYDDSLKGVVYASVNLVPNVTDVEGRVWPYWLAELSGTKTPQLTFEQTPSTELEPIRLSAYYIGEKMDEMKQLSDDLAARDAQLAQAQARIEELEAALKELEDAKTREDAEAAVAALDVPADVAVKLSALYVSDKSAYDVAAEAVAMVRASQPKADPDTVDLGTTPLELSARKAGVGQPVVDVVNDTPTERARLAYARMGAHNMANPDSPISFTDALRLV